MIDRFRPASGLQAIIVIGLLAALAGAACGSGDASVNGGDNPKKIRIVESTTIFTEEDIRAIGWKPQRDFVLDYPGATTFKWGFLNSKEVGILIYATAEEAKTLGVAAADGQTFRRPEDGQAPDEGIDRISCRDAAGQSAVKADTRTPAKAFSASYLDPDKDEQKDVLARSCSNRYPTYNDYTVIGNVVMMCEADGRNLLESSTNCKSLEKWLTQ